MADCLDFDRLWWRLFDAFCRRWVDPYMEQQEPQ